MRASARRRASVASYVWRRVPTAFVLLGRERRGPLGPIPELAENLIDPGVLDDPDQVGVAEAGEVVVGGRFGGGGLLVPLGARAFPGDVADRKRPVRLRAIPSRSPVSRA